MASRRLVVVDDHYVANHGEAIDALHDALSTVPVVIDSDQEDVTMSFNFDTQEGLGFIRLMKRYVTSGTVTVEQVCDGLGMQELAWLYEEMRRDVP